MTREAIKKLKDRQSKRERGGPLYTETLRIARVDSIPWTRGVPLPVRDRDLSTFRVHFHSAEAVVLPDPGENEIRIPYVVRYYPGDMKALLDELVRSMGHSRLRFVNLSPDGTASQLSRVMGIPEPRDLRDAVHGFRETTEEWANPDGDGTDEVECLVGEWDPETDREREGH